LRINFNIKASDLRYSLTLVEKCSQGLYTIKKKKYHYHVDTALNIIFSIKHCVVVIIQLLASIQNCPWWHLNLLEFGILTSF
jgi:hypothetical protein